MKFAIVVSEFNPEVTGGLLRGAKKFLASKKVRVSARDIYYAPGAFETPLFAKKLARTGKYDGVICLGCVIKGDTAHFEFISLGATVGIMQAMLETEVPISFGIITTYSEEQAEERSRADEHNKGKEAAAACWATASFIKSKI
jgi:6,7-dimethyl-8-ribityllumazine synthase